MSGLSLAREFMGQTEADDALTAMDGPHVVTCRSAGDSVPKVVVGPFPSVVEALAEAEQMEKDLTMPGRFYIGIAPLIPPGSRA